MVSLPIRIIVLAGNILLLKLGVVLLHVSNSHSCLAHQRPPLPNVLTALLSKTAVQLQYCLLQILRRTAAMSNKSVLQTLHCLSLGLVGVVQQTVKWNSEKLHGTPCSVLLRTTNRSDLYAPQHILNQLVCPITTSTRCLTSTRQLDALPPEGQRR